MKCITATFMYVATVAHDQCILTPSSNTNSLIMSQVLLYH